MSQPKYIIKNNEFILGRVRYHADLTTDAKGIIGGGWWQFLDDEKTELLLYGTSHEFNVIKRNQIIEVFTSGKLPDSIQNIVKVFHSPMLDIFNAEDMKDLILLRKGKEFIHKNSSK